MRRVSIGLLGCGTVGQGLVELLSCEQARIRNQFGVDLGIHRILVRDGEKPRRGIDSRLVTTSAMDVIDSPCDLVVELIGGTHSAGAFIRRAIGLGRHVVTANKALLASAPELFSMATLHGVRLGFEASVCGALPVVRVLQHGFAGDSIESVRGIVNGTCNYVLTRMEEDGLELPEAVRQAQARGFAEADPAFDIGGVDSAQKLRILARLAFPNLPAVKVETDGIGAVRAAAIDAARERDSVIRLIAEARRVPGGVALSVGPRVIARGDPLASVREENNGVVIRGRASGELLLTGKGAGSMPTAAAVLADVIGIVAGNMDQAAVA
jgi:homoserine dehydrogenase